MKICFTGDLSLHKTIINEKQNPFEEILPIIRECDFFITNLEAPFPNKENTENKLKNPRLIAENIKEEYLKILKPFAVSLANNHIYDSLEEGFKETVKILDRNGINYYGAGLDKERASERLNIELEGIKVSILFYVCEDTSPSLPKDALLYLNIFDTDKAINDIKETKKTTDFCIVYIHWGTEYLHYPSPEQQKIAKTLVKAGANAIFGTHAHAIQGAKKISNSLVVYGMGNFYLPDFIIERYNKFWKTAGKESLIVILSINSKNKYGYKFYRTRLVDGRLIFNNSLLKFKLFIYNVLSAIFKIKALWVLRLKIFKISNAIKWRFISKYPKIFTKYYVKDL